MAKFGDFVKINDTGLKKDAMKFGILNMGTTSHDTNFSQVADLMGKNIGTNGGQDYGDGMYDPALVIVHIEVDGKIVAKRVLIEFVTVVESR